MKLVKSTFTYNKNFIFIFITLLLQLIFCLGLSNKVISKLDGVDPKGMESLLQMSMQLGMQLGMKSGNTTKNVTVAQANNNSTNSKNATNATSAQDKVLEDAKAFKDVKLLLEKMDLISRQMNMTEKMNKEMKISVEDLKRVYDQLDYKVTINSIITDNKLNSINSRVVKQLKNQLQINLLNIQKEISEVQDEVEKLDAQIKAIKKQLPDTNSPCTLLGSCASCTALPQCGWCSVSSQCVEGTEKGPSDGSCTFYEYNICSGPRECDSYKNCKECTKDVGCGWCDKAGAPSCMSKDSVDGGKCGEDQFIHLWRSRNICPHNNIVIV